MTRLFKKISIALVAMFAVIGLAACAPAQPIDMSKVTSVIDVRTASEYAAGHLQGAVNIDVQSATFTDEISKLDKSGTYVLYCHSGKRAGVAKDTMTGLGFTNVTNAGGYTDASESTKLPIVTN
jgi:rhodanese-related sulfurtransferase